MDEIVEKIIGLDKGGQAKIMALEKEKQEFSTYTKSLRESLGQKYDQSSKETLAKREKEFVDDYDKRCEKIINETKMKESNIVKFYEKQKGQWLKELVAFCLEEK